jgi:serine/threonine protein kinase
LPGVNGKRLNENAKGKSKREPRMPAVDTFLKSVIRSGLLDSEQLESAMRAAPPDCQAASEAFAEHLVKAGKLSRYQAQKLLQGAVVGLVLGPFQILSPLGKGGMGTVYLARDSRDLRLVALKILPPKKAREQERHLARFQREMDLSQRVSHPHLAQTLETGVIQDVNYIAIEYIPGRNLYRLVMQEGPLNVPRAARLFAEVANGLDHAHLRGLIHRDLKPSNVMITPNDHVKVLDLGLALIQGELATDRTVVGGQGYVVGTMDYIAPEQADDAAKVDARSDIYSLGCVLYFALTGRPPFPGGDTRQKITRHRTEEPIPITQLNPSIPTAFAKFLGRLMAKKPEDRPASCDAVRAELLKWTTGEPVPPMDRVGDTNYRQAVQQLETQNNWPDLTADLVPISGSRSHRKSRFSGLSKNSFGESPSDEMDTHRGTTLLLLEIAGLIVVGMGMIFVLYIASR